jgi:hypothetical protein
MNKGSSKLYADLLLPYFQDMETLFVISRCEDMRQVMMTRQQTAPDLTTLLPAYLHAYSHT